MSKRTAEEYVADHGESIAPISATGLPTTFTHNPNNGYSLTKRPSLLPDDYRHRHKKRLSQQSQYSHQYPLLLDKKLDNKSRQYKYESGEFNGTTVGNFAQQSNKLSYSDTSHYNKKESCPIKQDADYQRTQQESSKHLVRSLSDLPVFVTVEGFRVASYTLDGEPYLCLPNLLQFIQQRYSIEKAVEIFEEIVTWFVSATPKQIEGFIKAGVLPPGAKTCPLVKRSDADKICLALFDQCSNTNISKNPLQQASRDTNETKERPCDYNGIAMRNKSLPTIISGRNLRFIDSSPAIKPPSPKSNGESFLKLDLPGGIASDQRLFEEEAQSGILDLARAATSTLIINVYHRCFGKCNGYYRPSLFKTAESECIECAICHRMLSPRRFVGHTHGSKESNTCHWGFDSYNWRQYIHLSRRQKLSNLDDDELIAQLRTLKSARDDSISRPRTDDLDRNKHNQRGSPHKLLSFVPIDGSRVSSYDDDESRQIKLDSGHQRTQQESSKHLIQSLSDLPVFVTVEGFRVASYTLDGEPYLCLPNLLQFIQQRYSIEKAVEIFEEIVTWFVSATPKQIEGFIKAGVLPPGAKTCPLVKRSDADKICLALFDQCSNTNISKSSLQQIPRDTNETKDAGDGICKMIPPAPWGKLSALEDTRNLARSNHKPSECNEIAIRLKKSSPTIISGRNLQFIDSSPAIKQSMPTGSGKKIQESYSSSNQQEGIANSEKLFEVEAQSGILDLARAATSTLIINVYHRCFGKCNGYYRPSLFKTAESECIECAICHRMLSPRRFVGHTHGSKESNTCHWGFDSYNWRQYIHLSRRQKLSNLDDDELIAQLETLKSAQDDSSSRAQNKDLKHHQVGSSQELSPFENVTR